MNDEVWLMLEFFEMNLSYYLAKTTRNNTLPLMQVVFISPFFKRIVLFFAALPYFLSKIVVWQFFFYEIISVFIEQALCFTIVSVSFLVSGKKVHCFPCSCRGWLVCPLCFSTDVSMARCYEQAWKFQLEWIANENFIFSKFDLKQPTTERSIGDRRIVAVTEENFCMCTEFI